MMNLKNVAIAATLVFGLSVIGGCQTSKTGSSTYGGSGFSKKSAIKKNGKTKSTSRSIIGPVSNPVEEGVEEIVNAGVGKTSVIKRKKVSINKGKKKRRIRKSSKSRSKKLRKSRRKSKRIAIRSRGSSKGRRSYDALIRRHARANGVPYALARAVVQVESGFRASARGKVGEIGLMQLRSRTARGMGYRGSSRGLYKPETNIKYGMRYLGKAYRLGGRSTCGAILKYNAGHGAKRMNPISRRYCTKVRRIIRGKV